MVIILVLATFVISCAVTKYIQSHKVDNTVMYYDHIGFTMADGKKETDKK